MTSKEALEQIMEKYIFYIPARSEGKQHLLNCLNIISKDLERLKKLEQTLGKIKDILTDKYNHEKYPFPDDVIDAISEVFDDDETS